MSHNASFPFVSDASLQELDERGQAIYARRLKQNLEAEHNNQYVVIHVDSEDYAVGRTFSEATRAMRERHPIDGRLFGRRIGDETEYSLAARIIASEMMEAQQK